MLRSNKKLGGRESGGEDDAAVRLECKGVWRICVVKEKKSEKKGGKE